MLADYVPILLRTTRQDEPHHRDPRLPDLAPKVLHPVFHGCYDWHSAVHSHWSMVRLLRHGIRPDLLRPRLAAAFEPGPIAIEAETVRNAPGFEEPYGLAWLLMLDGELALAGEWREALTPLTELARRRLVDWLDAPLDESGLHRQTAFSLWLLGRWATATGARDVADLVRTRARRHWGGASGRRLEGEAGPTDFLSPALTAAVVMAESIDGFPEWLGRFLPALADELPTPVVNPDPTDGHATHLDGLNLSRAWAARRIAQALPDGDPRTDPLDAFAAAHARAGLAASVTPHFAGSHWLPTFAILLLTQ